MEWAPIGFVRVYAADSGKLLWDHEHEAEARDQPPLNACWTGDRVLTHVDGKVTSRELATGRAVWTEPSDAPPVVSATHILLFNQSSVRVLDAAAGKTLASWNSAAGIGSSISTIVDGTIYTSDARGEQTIGGMVYHSTLCAVDSSSGKILWKSKEDKRTGYARPLVLDGMVVVVSDKKVYAIKQ
jgi:outer membrane protein assembly factor BamB